MDFRSLANLKRNTAPMKPSDPRRDRPLSIWIIDEGHPGHTNQSWGLVDALARQTEIDCQSITARFKLPGALRSIMRASLCRFGGLPFSVTRRLYSNLSLPNGTPDLLVSSGGRSIPLALSLRRSNGCRHAFLGEVKPYPPSLFDILLTPANQPGAAHTIETDLLVTRVTPEACQKTGDAFRSDHDLGSDQFVAAMIVGGTSRSHRFVDSDWADLARGMNTLHERLGWSWLLTTSRRTGPTAENLLRRQLKTSAIIDAVWWNTNPQRVMQKYLGAANLVCVTRDSLTMVSEAVSSGRPTVVLSPREIRPSIFLDAAFSKALGARRILNLRCAELPRIDRFMTGIEPVEAPQADGYAKQLLAAI